MDEGGMLTLVMTQKIVFAHFLLCLDTKMRQSLSI